MNKTIALITAAGNGQRMNHTENKLFLKIKGMSIIQRTVQTFLKINSIERLYLTVQSQELNKMQDELKNLDGSNKLRFVIGGQTRQESILNGLEKIALDFKEVTKSVKNEMICLIHDGARPLIEKSTIQQCIEEIKTNHCGIGVAVPINDTIHMIDQNQNIINTPDRANLIAIQTPQGALFEQLLFAHRLAKANNFQATDDISVLRYAEIPAKIYFGHINNIKITLPQDRLIAERILDTMNK